MSDGSALPPELDPRRRRPTRRAPGPASPAGTPVAAGSSTVVPAPPAPRRRLRKVLAGVAVALSTALFLVSGVGYLLYNHYDGNIDRFAIGDVPGGPRPERAPVGALNVLMVGSDTRDFAGGEAFQGKGAKRVTNARSDTMILAHLYGGADKAQLVSLPRDSRVTIPAYTDSSGRQRGPVEDKLNAAMERGGPALLIATVEQLTDIKIDHFVQVDFQGFQNLVEELEGVEVCLTEPAQDKDSGIDLRAGRQTIRGPQALAFVRQRQGLPGNELGRIKRQQQFIGAVAREVLGAGTLLNPVKLNGVLSVATGSLKVDDSLSPDKLRDLALRLRNFEAGDILFTTVPLSDTDLRAKNPDGLYSSYVQLDDAKAAKLFEGIRRDEEPGNVTTPRPVATPPLIVRPGAVRVEVYNGAGVAGLGKRAAADLERVGFNVVGTPSDRGEGVPTTVVRHGPEKADSARTLAAAIPGATVEQDPALGRTLEVVVGSDYSTARKVTVKPSVSASPAPAASPRVTTAAEDVCGV